MHAPTSERNSSTIQNRLDLETPGPSATTSALELAALAGDLGLLVGVGAETEVLDSLTCVLGATEEESVGTSRGAESKLVEGESLASGFDDASTGRSGEAESSDGDLRELKKTVVIRDRGNDDDGLSLCTVSVFRILDPAI